MSSYVELQVTSDYSFLRGASHIEELFLTAKAFGYDAIAITDRNTLAGIARAHARATELGIRLVVGCRLDLADATPVLVYPTDRAAYARLCRLLTLGKGRTGKGGCDLSWRDLVAHGDGQIVIALPDLLDREPEAQLARLARDFPGRAYVGLTILRRPNDYYRISRMTGFAEAAGVPTVVLGDVLYHAPGRRILQDVLTCVREHCTIEDAGIRRELSVDRHLKPPEEMVRLFRHVPEAVARSADIAARCRFSLTELRYQYPTEADDVDELPQQTLEHLVAAAIPDRYPGGAPPEVARQLRHELDLIAQLEYAPYFLTVNTIVRYARSKDILCQGRGSAANSAVCYVLGITSIDPVRSGLLFERFVSAERREPPDIDVDFESDRREEVIQWIYERYGRDRAALCATVMRYRPKGAVRDVGKVLGLTEDVTAVLSAQSWAWADEPMSVETAAQLGLNLGDRRLRLTMELARTLVGFPRQLGTHPGGFVLTQDRLDELVPLEPAAMAGRQVIEWDKDDIDQLKFMKVDVLGLGMLGCLRRAFEMIEAQTGRRLDIASIPAEDAATYAMIRKADTLGTFQIESRAQMAMLPRLKPTTFYDLVVQVAIVRPGPIQGDMVHPYLRRREGKEPVHYPKPELRRVLGKTLGVPLFQEQAMQVAVQCAGFTPGEADQLRRSMATFKVTGGVSHFKDKLIEGMVERGYDRTFAERTFSQLEGFGSYGFPESHAASFALVAYASAWVKCHHPAVFCAALLNSQPMGFYAPAQIKRDASDHGIEVRPVCVNASRWDCTLETPRRGRQPAVRLGMRLVHGLQNEAAGQLIAAREPAPFRTIEEIWRRAGSSAAALERLADADAFHSLGVDRRQAVWQASGLADSELPLFAAIAHRGPTEAEPQEPAVALPPMLDGHQVIDDYRSTGLSLKAHPLAFLREDLLRRGAAPCAQIAHTRDGRRMTLAGLVLMRQRPGSAKGVMFITIEDETSIANLVVWADRFEKQRAEIISARLLICHGRLQREGDVTHVIVDHVEDATRLLGRLTASHDATASSAGVSSSSDLRTRPRDFR